MEIAPVTLRTQRLTLRAPTEADVPAIAAMCNDREVYDNTLSLPFPYTEDDARAWTERAAEGCATGDSFQIAAFDNDTGALAGTGGLVIEQASRRAELGYIVARPMRNQGFATEISRALIAFGFEKLDLMRICGGRYPYNPASGRVLEKAGMTYEGLLRNYEQKGDKTLDVHLYAITREDFEGAAS